KDLVKVWETETLQLQSEINSNRGFHGVLWTPGGELIVGDNRNNVFSSSVNNVGKKIVESSGLGFRLRWFALSPDGSRLMLPSDSTNSIFVRNLRDKTFIQFNPRTLSPTAGIFHPDGKTLVLFGENLRPQLSLGDSRQNGLVELWSISENQVKFSGSIILKDRVESVAVHPNGEMLAAGLYSGLSSSKIELWNIKNRENPVCFKKLGLHKNSVAGLAFTPDGRFLFSAGDINGTLLAKEEEKYDRLGVWSMADISASRNACASPITKPRESFNCEQYGGCNRIAISHDGSRWLFSKGREGRLALEIIFYR
ncbi:MAG: WD40 repeat domain-containing protein, partial [Myxococcota bacterium]